MTPTQHLPARTTGWAIDIRAVLASLPAPRAVLLVGLVASLIVGVTAITQANLLLLACELVILYTILREAMQIQDRDQATRALAARIDRERLDHRRLVGSARTAAVGELAAGVAHEINNPLTSVLGYADLLIASSTIDGPARADLEVIKTEAIRARQVIWALLDYARPRPLVPVPTALSLLVSGCVDLVRADLEAGSAEVIESYADLPLQLVDPTAIQHAVGQVLANARAAMPRGGVLTVTAGRDGAVAVIRIEDDGAGMSDETRLRAFEPFFSLAGGQGLGLSVARGIVEAHDGSIELATAEGGGTAAEIRLPIVEPAA